MEAGEGGGGDVFRRRVKSTSSRRDVRRKKKLRAECFFVLFEETLMFPSW